MRNSKTQVMCCGACAVRMDENGQTITSIDMLANCVRNFFSKVSGHHGSSVATQMRA